MPSKIVAHFKDGTILKGYVADIHTNKDTFHMNDYKTNKGQVIYIEKLKAVFFVKTFEGNKEGKNKLGFHGANAFGIRTVVKFHDGEVVYGYTQDYTPYANGFYLFPDDKESNNTKVFIPKSSVFDIKLGEDINKSEYGKAAPKYLKKIIPKVSAVTLEIVVGTFPLEGAKVKVVETGEVKELKKGEEAVSLNLKPGTYNLEIAYDKYLINKTILVDQTHISFRIDLQTELH